MIEAGAVARIEVSENGNEGRIVDVVGRPNDRYWIVADGAPFIGYAPGTTSDIPIAEREHTESLALGIEAWKLRRVY